MYAAEEAARFLHHACRGLPLRANGHGGGADAANQLTSEDRFYSRALEDALAYFGSRVLCPARPALREADLQECYEQTREDLEQQTSLPFSDFLGMIDFLVLHRDFELKAEGYSEIPLPIQQGIEASGVRFEYLTQELGYMLGTDLYDAYLEGRVTRSAVRQLFLAHLREPGSARQTYFTLAYQLRTGKKKPQAVRETR